MSAKDMKASALEAPASTGKLVDNSNAALGDVLEAQPSNYAIAGRGAAYCCTSVAMVIFNKLALSSFPFSSPTGLLLIQCVVCVVLVTLCVALGWTKKQTLNWAVLRIWLPVNFLFVGMVWTGFAALQLLSVPMVTVLKNLAGFFTIVGDRIFFGRVYSIGVWAVLALMTASAFAGGLTDLEFDLAGYWWQLANCLLTAAFSLYLRGAMDAVKQVSPDNQRLNEASMVFLNNMLSIPMLLIVLVANGEVGFFFDNPTLRDPQYQLAALGSGIVAFAISFCSVWFLQTTTATTYSLVGSLNKIPITVISLMLFKTANAYNVKNMVSVGIGLVGGIVFCITKAKDAQDMHRQRYQPVPVQDQEDSKVLQHPSASERVKEKDIP